MFKNFFVACFLITSFFCANAQFSIDKKWQFGIGGGLVKFSDKDAPYIGDKHLAQIPRFNATYAVKDKFALDAAFSFGSFDSAIITTNQVPYFSFDVSGRYHFLQNIRNFEPFAFVGVSLVDSSRKMTPTINLGAGATYWFSKVVGISTNFYYKHSLDSFESMRSHIQISFGVVFGLDLSGSGRRGSTDCKY